MGRAYAGILGPIGFGTVIARSLVNGEHVEAALVAAPFALFTFAAIGYVAGVIADRTIVDAIETKFHAQLQADESARSAERGGTTSRAG